MMSGPVLGEQVRLSKLGCNGYERGIRPTRQSEEMPRCEGALNTVQGRGSTEVVRRLAD